MSFGTVVKNNICQMKTLFGTELKPENKAVIYWCNFNHQTNEIIATGENIFNDLTHAYDYYANVPNPASQIAAESDTQTLEESLTKLHNFMDDEEWRLELSECL